MWRNSKRSSAGLGLELPPRTLTLTRLHFTPAEHTFYSHILEKTREARDALHHHEHQSNADSAGPSTASPNQSGRSLGVLMAHHMRVIRCRIPNMKNAVLFCALPRCAVLCHAVLCHARSATESAILGSSYFTHWPQCLHDTFSVSATADFCELPGCVCDMPHVQPHSNLLRISPTFCATCFWATPFMAKAMLLLCRAPTGNPNTPHPQASLQSMPKGASLDCLSLLCRVAAGLSSQPGFLQSMPKDIIDLCLSCREAAGVSSQPAFLQSMPEGIIVLCFLCREAAGVSSQPGSQAV